MAYNEFAYSMMNSTAKLTTMPFMSRSGRS